MGIFAHIDGIKRCC